MNEPDRLRVQQESNQSNVPNKDMGPKMTKQLIRQQSVYHHCCRRLPSNRMY